MVGGNAWAQDEPQFEVYPPEAARRAEQAVPDDEEPFVKVSAKVRASVVAIGSYHPKDKPTAIYFGTGFVIIDGNTVATNQHVVEAIRKQERLNQLRVFYPDDGAVRGRAAMLIAEDAFHDVAILRMVGTPLPSLDLAPDTQGDPPQGRGIALMGYPLGFRLGLVPTVHKGVVAAVVPAVQPLPAGAKLTPELVEAIDKPFKLYQLDIVAFPGNSGSPLFDARNGQVLGIINKVLGNKTREHLIENPSGISYAVPARWIHEAVIRAAISAEEKRNATLRDGFR